MSDVSARSSRECAGLHSPPVKRSFEVCTGIARVVVAISPLHWRPRSGRRGHGRRLRRLRSRKRRSRSHSRGGKKNCFKQLQKFAHLRLADQKSRQQANRKFVRAIDEQAAMQRFAHERATFNGKFHAEHATFAANFLYEIAFGLESFQTGAEFGPAYTNIF